MSEEERVCRICLGGEDDNDGGNHLISPCLCRGSMCYVHISCLQAWRRASTRQDSALQCDQCHYKYNIHRTALALFLLSENGPVTLAILFLVVVVHVIGICFYAILSKVTGGSNGVEEVMQRLFLWLRLGRYSMTMRSPATTFDIESFLTETAYGEILVLGTASLALIAFCHSAYKTLSGHYIQYRRGEGHDPIIFQFDPLIQGGAGMFLFWIYHEIVEAKSGRGVAVMGLFSAWYYTYGRSIESAKSLAQWMGESILEPTQSL
mmetsp:Transcript_37787/g.57534  ORF Transcript_37787/g.57534 Transcript_37787/m.57534 type:complete len:264 (-) Transcript_37787:297-1088(-)